MKRVDVLYPEFTNVLSGKGSTHTTLLFPIQLTLNTECRSRTNSCWLDAMVGQSIPYVTENLTVEI